MEEEAFKAFFGEVKGPLLGYLRQVAGEAVAEDLFQEALLRLLERPPRETEPAARRAWLFSTATRLLHDRWRRERRLAWLPWGGDGGDHAEPPCDRPLPDHLAWTRQAVDLGWRTLTARQRALLWLAHVEGFDHHELARALRLTPASARVLLHRARQRMAGELARHGIEGGRP